MRTDAPFRIPLRVIGYREQYVFWALALVFFILHPALILIGGSHPMWPILVLGVVDYGLAVGFAVVVMGGTVLTTLRGIPGTPLGFLGILIGMLVTFAGVSAVALGTFSLLGLSLERLGVTTTNFRSGDITVSHTVIGGMGAALGLYGAVRAGRWRLTQLRQLRNLAKARAASAPLGLVELEGRVRPLDEARPGLETETGGSLLPFRLEDDSGSILIDPGAARVRSWMSSLAVGAVICEAELARRDKLRPSRRWLEAGDRVYVIGNVERRDDAHDAEGSDALVVRRASRKGADYLDIFFITDRSENAARRALWKNLLAHSVTALVWMIPCVTLIVMAQWDGWR